MNERLVIAVLVRGAELQVSVQEKLADYLVNSSANGGIMMKEVYNAIAQYAK